MTTTRQHLQGDGLVDALEQELLYCLGHQGGCDLSSLLIILDEVFPQASAGDVAEALSHLMARGDVQLKACGICAQGEMPCLHSRLSLTYCPVCGRRDCWPMPS